MRNIKDEFSLEINEHYSVLAYPKTIKISQIRGLKAGGVYGHNVKLLTSPIVKKDGDSYVLLNYGDPRISSILDKYDSNTKVEVMIIPGEHSEVVEFLTSDLNPQITPSTSFTDFFTNLSQSHSKQIFVRDFFTRQGSRSKSKLAFNLKRFIEKLGANAPTQSTASKLASSVTSNEISKPTLEKPGTTLHEYNPISEINTPPTSDRSHSTQNTEDSKDLDKEDPLIEAAAETYYSIEPTTYDSNTYERIDTRSEQNLTEEKALSYDEYHKSDVFLNSFDNTHDKEASIITSHTTEVKIYRSLSEEEMSIKWEKYSNSDHSLDVLRSLLSEKENYFLSERLTNLQIGTPKFDKFLSDILKILDERYNKLEQNDHNN